LNNVLLPDVSRLPVPQTVATEPASVTVGTAQNYIYLPLILRNAGSQISALPPLRHSVLAYPALALGMGLVVAGLFACCGRRPRPGRAYSMRTDRHDHRV